MVWQGHLKQMTSDGEISIRSDGDGHPPSKKLQWHCVLPYQWQRELDKKWCLPKMWLLWQGPFCHTPCRALFNKCDFSKEGEGWVVNNWNLYINTSRSITLWQEWVEGGGGGSVVDGSYIHPSSLHYMKKLAVKGLIKQCTSGWHRIIETRCNQVNQVLY